VWTGVGEGTFSELGRESWHGVVGDSSHKLVTEQVKRYIFYFTAAMPDAMENQPGDIA